MPRPESAPSHLPLVRAAVVQAGSVLYDTPRTLSKLADWTADAARQGAQLVVFPEAFLGGYPKGHSFGVTLGRRTAPGRDEFRELYENAIDVPGEVTRSLGVLARDHGVHLVVGVVERSGGTLYCSALILDPTGQLAGHHRKLMPTAFERVLWGSGDGSMLPVVETPLGKVGAVICWENYMPLLRTAMYAQGIELYCALTVDDRDTWIPTMRHVALEGRCFVLSACQYLPGEPGEGDASGSSGSTSPPLPIRGGSCIVGPLGEILAGPRHESEGLVIADLDRRDLARARFDFDVVGHYARPDVFQLSVDRRPQTPVVFTDS